MNYLWIKIIKIFATKGKKVEVIVIIHTVVDKLVSNARRTGRVRILLSWYVDVDS